MDPQLFARVPPEVWEMIFEYVEWNASTLLNCLNFQARGSWYDVLSKKATTFLLPLVLPSLRDELATDDILTLRRVCKPWRSGVDSFLEEMSPYYPVPSKTVYRHAHEPEMEWFGENMLGTACNSSQQIEELMREMKNFKDNPLVNNTVTIFKDNTETNGIRLYQKFTNLIENFGHYIVTCVYKADESIECNHQMQYLFVHLPNLKCLTIEKNPVWDRDVVEESLNWLRNPDSLPPLKNLKSLNLVNSVSLMNGDYLYMNRSKPYYSLCDSLLKRYGRQLYSLQVEMYDIKCSPFFSELAIQRRALENLRALKIHDSGQVSLLNKISVFQLPHLERLYMNFTADDCVEIDGSRCGGLKSVLRLINKFSSTLVELRWPFYLFNSYNKLKEHYNDEAEFINDISIKLPHVKWTGIPYTYIYSSLGQSILNQLLDKFPNLEHLHVMDYDEGYLGNLLQLELHDLARRFIIPFPSIKNVTVEEGRTNNILFNLIEWQNERRQQQQAELERRRDPPVPVAPVLQLSSDDENEYYEDSESDD